MSNILLSPDLFTNAYAASPPTEYVVGVYVVNAGVAYTFSLEGADVEDFVDDTMLAGYGTIQHDTLAGLFLNVVVDGVVVQSLAVPANGLVDVSFGVNVGGAETAGLVLSATAAGITPAVVALLTLSLTPTAGVSYNCTCSDAGGRTYRTLKEIRDAVMRRLGWGNQLLNPPPGSVEMINSFLYEAQYSLYNRFNSLRGLRYFTWQLVEGVALYGLHENVDDCSKRLNPDKIRWVGVVRPGNLWTTLVAGIPPMLNSYPNTSGFPVRYDVRQCIQVWPVPHGSAGQLVIEGVFDLLPFVEDNDVATVDDSLIFSLALADAKAHYRQPDADRYVQRAEVLLNALVAGTHTTKRYIPGRNRGRDLIYVEPMPSVPFDS